MAHRGDCFRVLPVSRAVLATALMLMLSVSVPAARAQSAGAAPLSIPAESEPPIPAAAKMLKPFGMSFDERGSLLIADIEQHAIVELDAELRPVRRIDAVAGYGPLTRPFDVRCRGDLRYILDTGRGNVVIADDQWRLVRVIGAGQAGSAAGEFAEPHFLAPHPDGTLLVADTLNHRVQRFDDHGRFLGAWTGTTLGGAFPLNTPTGIAALADGRVVVAEYGDGAPALLSSDGEVLARLERFGLAYAAAAHGDRIAIVWTYSNRVSVHDDTGKLLFVLGTDSDSAADGEFNKPAGVAFDPEGQLYVSEWRNHRIQQFDRDGRWLRTVQFASPALANPKDLPRYSRPRPDEPVRLGAFVRLLSPAQVGAYHDAGVRSLYFQPYEDIFSPRLRDAVAAAHALGMRAYMVFDTYMHGARSGAAFGAGEQPSHFARENPQFYTRKRDGTPSQAMLSYVYPEVRAWKVRQILEALDRCGADGVVLDYIRWPAGLTEGYDEPALRRFEQQYGISALSVPPDDPRWTQHRANYITQFLSELRAAVDVHPRRLTVGVYIDADPSGEMKSVGRDWTTWARLGLLDGLHHMLYTDDFAAIHAGVRAGRDRGGDGVRVVACIDVYCGFLPNESMLRRGADAAARAGADEVVIVRDGAIERLQLFDAMRRVSDDLREDGNDDDSK